MEEIDLRVDKAKVETVAHKWWRRIFHKSSLEFSFIIDFSESISSNDFLQQFYKRYRAITIILENQARIRYY